MNDVLDDDAIQQALAGLPGWALDDSKLFREYRFTEFREAFAFMTRVAELADMQDHHPDWYNSYTTVRIWLISHDVGGITQRDMRLANSINQLRP
ncbi:MAG: 4a-hydroxytetrahydrobiopterin dehydratase [Gammaproteobacteria bacterium]|nr:MAG: 4a-hydroxytetrahydrobiopterin dehydratase [Gammaproteobacteria bacterium]